MWVKDATHTDRYLLGPCSFFKDGGMMARIPNCLVPAYVHGLKMNSGWPREEDSEPRTLDVGEETVKIPRPPNAFIIFRCARHAEIKKANPQATNGEICRFSRPYSLTFSNRCSQNGP